MCTLPTSAQSAQPPSPPPQNLLAQPPSPSPPGAAPQDLTVWEIMTRYRSEIEAASRETGIPEEIIAGMIWQESKGRPNTPGGGLLQLGPNEFASYGGGDINNPLDNIRAGARYLKELHDRFGSWELALRAYNSGPNGVDPGNFNATPAGTGDPTYVDKVLRAAREVGFSG